MTKVFDIKIQAENICFKAYVHVWASLFSPKCFLKLFINDNHIWQSIIKFLRVSQKQYLARQ